MGAKITNFSDGTLLSVRFLNFVFLAAEKNANRLGKDEIHREKHEQSMLHDPPRRNPGGSIG